MSISWLMIFLLLTDFILINSDRSSVNSIDAENKGTDADAKDINLSNTGSNSLFKFNDFEAFDGNSENSDLLQSKDKASSGR